MSEDRFEQLGVWIMIIVGLLAALSVAVVLRKFMEGSLTW